MRQNAYIPTSIGPTEDRGDSNTSKNTLARFYSHKLEVFAPATSQIWLVLFFTKGRPCDCRIRKKEAKWKHLARQWKHTWGDGWTCLRLRKESMCTTSGQAALAREARSPRQVHRNKIASCPDPRLGKQLGVHAYVVLCCSCAPRFPLVM